MSNMKNEIAQSLSGYCIQGLLYYDLKSCETSIFNIRKNVHDRRCLSDKRIGTREWTVCRMVNTAFCVFEQGSLADIQEKMQDHHTTNNQLRDENKELTGKYEQKSFFGDLESL